MAFCLIKSFHAIESPLQLSHQSPPPTKKHLWVQVAHPTPLIDLGSVKSKLDKRTPFQPEPGISRKQTLQQTKTYKTKHATNVGENWLEMTRCFGSPQSLMPTCVENQALSSLLYVLGVCHTEMYVSGHTSRKKDM